MNLGRSQLLTLAFVSLGVVSLFQNCSKVNFQNAGGLVAGTDKITNTADTPPPPGCIAIPPGNPTPTPTPTGGEPNGGGGGGNNFIVMFDNLTGDTVMCPPGTIPVSSPTPMPSSSPNPNPSASPMPNPSASPVLPPEQPVPSPTPKHPGNPGGPNNPPGNPGTPPGTDGGNPNTGGDGICYLTSAAGGNGKSDRIGETTATTVKYLQVAHGIPSDACMSANACLTIINTYLNTHSGSLTGAPSTAPSPMLTMTGWRWHAVCKHNPNVQHLTDAQVTTDLTNQP